MIIPSGHGQLAWRFSLAGSTRQAVVTCGVRFDGLLDPAVQTEAAFLAWETNVIPRQSNSVTLIELALKYGPTATGPTHVFSGSVPGANNATAPQSPQVAILIEKRTALGGRMNRGRMYVPGVPTGDVGIGGQLDAPDLASWSAAADGLYDDLVAAGMAPVILHSTSSDPTTVTEFVVDPAVATQRRRLR